MLPNSRLIDLARKKNDVATYQYILQLITEQRIKGKILDNESLNNELSMERYTKED